MPAQGSIGAAVDGGIGTGMGDVLKYRPKKEREETTAYLGMIIFLGSWAMMFGALFFGYAFVRLRSTSWPPPGVPDLSPWLPALNTLVIALSSLTMQLALKSARAAKPRRVGPSLAVTAVLGSVFLFLQVLIWRRFELSPGEGGAYSSVLFGLSGFHALHVLVGLLALAGLSWRGFKGEFTAAKHLPVRLWALYWHFVGVVWALMFVALFVL